MNIRQTLVRYELAIQAGGPGSGRHKEVLTKAGFEQTGNRYGKQVYTVSSKGHEHQGHEVLIGKDGSWEHNNKYGSRLAGGRDAHDLANHIDPVIHKKDFIVKD